MCLPPRLSNNNGISCFFVQQEVEEPRWDDVRPGPSSAPQAQPADEPGPSQPRGESDSDDSPPASPGYPAQTVLAGSPGQVLVAHQV